MIKVKDLNYTYSKGLPHESIALHEVNFSIEDNTILGIIGHTGSGKSTLLQQLNGLLKPESGNIFIDEIDITDTKVKMVDIRRKVGLVFQYPEYQLFEETVEKDVAFGPKNLGLSEEDIRQKVKESIEAVGLDFELIKDKSPFELSGGQKRCVAIAGVLAMSPDILILDEPTAGLDPKTHKNILEMIVKIHRKKKGITIIVSHNMDDIAELCEKILVMDSGKVIMEGTAKEIFDAAKSLEELGLALPSAKQLSEKVKVLGIDIGDEIITLKQAEKAILEMKSANTAKKQQGGNNCD
ncbi:MAG: energy-coupling factor transporter ATPase [Anaerovoracaceae bacterium]